LNNGGQAGSAPVPADLAAAELSAAGQHARARTPETLTTLTPQESRIADLTAEIRPIARG
jgi:hypothetical protein